MLRLDGDIMQIARRQDEDADMIGDLRAEVVELRERDVSHAILIQSLLVEMGDLRAALGLDARPPPGPQWLRLKLAASRAKVSNSTMRSWIRSGKINSTKIGLRYFIDARTLPAAAYLCFCALSAAPSRAYHARMTSLFFDPLLAEKTALGRAEENLTQAREALKTAAKGRQISLANLLGDTQFVSRARAEEWIDNAFANGRREGCEEAQESRIELSKIAYQSGYKAAMRACGRESEADRAERQRFEDLREAMISNARNAKLYDIDPSQCDASYVQMRKQLAQAQNLFKLGEAAGLTIAEISELLAERPNAKSIADQIVRAGAKARGHNCPLDDAPDDDDDDMRKKTAKAIVEAGTNAAAGLARSQHWRLFQARRRQQTARRSPF
jgi:hypothetical protein